ncbi:hypothetical protein [Bosea sp. ANAM02]|uniref:hypothetical protein n=1 Tax=Bosea sp. ANAM02 TaxID=2020412 RepID=UPI00140F45A7|nr:hypothetical protein [Bosea sp. ANAM02]BCB17332.1 hypothetical protein OCUBac02_02260 [Bosea sp. ANAM02]
MADRRKPRGGSRSPSRRLTASDAAIIKNRILRGEFLNRIAADFDVNPGRISEIKTGKRFAEVPPAA